MEEEVYNETDIYDADEFEAQGLDADGGGESDRDDAPIQAGDDIEAEKEKSDIDEEAELNTSVSSYSTPDGGGRRSSRAAQDDERDDDDDDDEEEQLTTYGKIASALRDDGVLYELDDDEEEVRTADDFRDAIERRIQQGINERVARVNAALDMGVPKEGIQANENLLRTIETYTDDVMRDESDQGVQNRHDMIVYAAKERGMSPERAEREWQKSYKAGTDIEDALDARDEVYAKARQEYADMLAEHQESKRQEELSRQQFYDSVDSIVCNADEGVFQGLSKNVRAAVMDSEQDFDKYVYEHPEAYRAVSRLLYVLTDGYNNFDRITKSGVRKGVKSSLQRLERTLKGGDRTRGGGYRIANSLEEDNGVNDWNFV